MTLRRRLLAGVAATALFVLGLGSFRTPFVPSSTLSATVTHVQTILKQCAAAASPCTTAAFTTTAGNFLHVTAILAIGANFTSVTDSKTETWVQDTSSPLTFNTSYGLRGYYVLNCKCGASQTVSVNYTSAFDTTIFVSEFTHVAVASATDANASTAATVQNPTSGATGTRTQAAELLYAYFGSAEVNLTTVTAGTNVAWTIPTNGSVLSGASSPPGGVEYFVASSTGTDAGTFNSGASSAKGTIIQTFKDDSGATTRGLLLGVLP